MSTVDNKAIENFREYLKIPSVHPNVNYDSCVSFLKKQAGELELPVRVYEIVPKKPVVIITWKGTEPNLSAILLNSHMDVVPVFENKWKYPPFSAHMDAEGNIFARGTQDMKSVAIQYIEAVRLLKTNGVQLKRTLHLSFVPDEEIGGIDGMAKFVHTQEFRELNIGFSLDEGMTSPSDTYLLFNGERTIWHVIVKCPGQAGHGSLLLENTAGEKIRYIIDKFMDFRKQEKKKLESNPELTIGDVTTINLTKLMGGVQSNVVPEELTAVFDIRIALSVNMLQFEAMLNTWCQQAGKGVHLDYEQKAPQSPITKLDESNTFWMAFKQTTDKLKLKLKQQIFPAGTDSRYIRALGIPAIGFSPIINTPILLHDHNECLNKNTFLDGIHIYKHIIASLANVVDTK